MKRQPGKTSHQTTWSHPPVGWRCIYVPTLTPGQTQNPLEGLYISSGLGTPRDPPGGTGKCGWGEGSLGGPASPAATATRPWISGREWMDGWILVTERISSASVGNSSKRKARFIV